MNFNKIAHSFNSIKMPQVIGIFILLVAMLYLSPTRTIQKIISSILGRMCLVGFVVFFASHNILLGIGFTMVLFFLIQNNMKSFVVEGMESKESKANLKKPNKIDELLQSADTNNVVGVDKQSIHESIQAKSSNTLPIASSASSDDVGPSTESKSSFSMSESFI